MAEKLLISLKEDVEFDLKIAFIGCRTIRSNYTYSKLISSLLNNALDSKPPIVISDDCCRFYTLKECYEKGLYLVNSILNEFENYGEGITELFDVLGCIEGDSKEEILLKFIMYKLTPLLSFSQASNIVLTLVDRVKSDSEDSDRLVILNKRF